MEFKVRSLIQFLLTPILVATLIFTLSLSDQAEARKKKRRKSSRTKISWQTAIVKVDGAQLYKAPHFDAPVLSVAPIDKKVLISHNWRQNLRRRIWVA